MMQYRRTSVMAGTSSVCIGHCMPDGIILNQDIIFLIVEVDDNTK